MGDFSLDLIDLIVKIVVTIAAGAAYWIGLRQYKRGQNWQKADVILKLIDSFESDKKIGAACEMIDWDEREVALDEKKVIHFKNEMLISALRVPKMDISTDSSSIEGDGSSFNEEESIMRDSFDAFFDYFDKLYAFRRSGLLSINDCSYFFYWFELIRQIGDYKENHQIKLALDKYINSYHFVGIQKLLEEYSQSPEPLHL